MRSESTSALGQPSETKPTLGGAVTRAGMRRWRGNRGRRSASMRPGDKRAAILAKAHAPAASLLPDDAVARRSPGCLLLHPELGNPGVSPRGLLRRFSRHDLRRDSIAPP